MISGKCPDDGSANSRQEEIKAIWGEVKIQTPAWKCPFWTTACWPHRPSAGCRVALCRHWFRSSPCSCRGCCAVLLQAVVIVQCLVTRGMPRTRRAAWYAVWMATSVKNSPRLSAIHVFKNLLFFFSFSERIFSVNNIHDSRLGMHPAFFLAISAQACGYPPIFLSCLF